VANGTAEEQLNYFDECLLSNRFLLLICGRGSMNQWTERRSTWSWWYLLFLIQFVAVLWPPFYNSVEPTLMGIPFFYWYQLAWVIIGAILTAIVYFATRD
jgi:hypothetical protein